jgi:hypothetical protein
MVTLLIESMNKSPVKRSNLIVVKVVHGGDRSPQYEIFKVAFASFKMSFNKNVDRYSDWVSRTERNRRKKMESKSTCRLAAGMWSTYNFDSS